jgi:hypothetical protein
MKLCSQCEFIYEDDQERCDMDGALLVYEPTLESVFQTALEAKSKLKRPVPAKLIMPLSTSRQCETSTPPPNIFAARGRFALQIAAGIVLAVVAIVAFYASPRLFQTRTQTSVGTVESQSPPHGNSEPSPTVSDTSVMSEKPETPNAKLETSPLSDKLQTRNAKREAAVPALPGLKPLPRLKPLPTLKPLPRLADQSRSQNPSPKAAVVNTKVNANTKKESRFGSFLKKTGRILTKPFKS